MPRRVTPKIGNLSEEEIHWLRTKRKCLMIFTATVCLCLINVAMAHRFDGDDVVRTALSALVVGVSTWYGTSKNL